MGSAKRVSLLEAAQRYVNSLKAKDRQSQAQPQVLKFVQWYGADKIISEMEPPLIEEYGEHAVGVGSSAHAVERLEEVRRFLSFAKRSGLTEHNFAQHLRVRKSRSRSRAGTPVDEREVIELTPEGHNQLARELEKLKARRAPIASEIGRAAADKDVRENTPLEAAREQLGLIESRIAKIENIMKAAVIMSTSKQRGRAVKVGMGAKVVLKDLDSGRELRYTLVNAAEANPLDGKISDVSPVGKALMRRTAGQEIEVATPRGKLRYRVVRVS